MEILRFRITPKVIPAHSLIFHCNYCNDVQPIKDAKLPALKRGTGGRSSFNGLVATVFGSNGFLGRYVCNKLGKIGTQLILPYRCDAYEMTRLKLVGDLGQVVFQQFDLKDEKSIFKAMQYSNVVINLIGRDWETKNFSFNEVHVEGARRIAKISKEVGIETFIHISALNACESPEPFMIKGGSKFLASKWRGEQAVREVFPEAIIFRPSDIYGQEDRFLNYFSHHLRHQGKAMPLYRRGKFTEKQPVYVSDVASGIVAACRDKSSRGNIYQAIGPRRYLLKELVDWFHRIMNKGEDWGYFTYDMRFDPLFQLRYNLFPKISPFLPVANLHPESIERECHSDKIEKIPTLEDLGIVLTKMEDQVPWELKPFKSDSYYDLELEEFEEPNPPKTL